MFVSLVCKANLKPQFCLSQVDHYYREEAMLDSWIATLKAQQEKQLQKAVENRITTLGEDNDQIMPLNFVLSKDIIEALYYPTQPAKPPMDAPSIVPERKDPSESTTPQSSVIAIHAPKDGVVAVSSQPNEKKYRLNIAEKTDLQKIRDELKRKEEEENQDPYSWNTKRQRLIAPATCNGETGPIQVYLMPVEYNSKLEKMISAGAKTAANQSGFRFGNGSHNWRRRNSWGGRRRNGGSTG